MLSPAGLLRNESEIAICSRSIREPAIYNSILQAVAGGLARRSEIEQQAGVRCLRAPALYSLLQFAKLSYLYLAPRFAALVSSVSYLEDE